MRKVLFFGTIVVTENLLVQIAIQMERFDT